MDCMNLNGSSHLFIHDLWIRVRAECRELVCGILIRSFLRAGTCPKNRDVLMRELVHESRQTPMIR